MHDLDCIIPAVVMVVRCMRDGAFQNMYYVYYVVLVCVALPIAASLRLMAGIL